MKTMIDYTCKKRQMVNLKTYQDRIKVYITLLLFFLVKQKYEEIFLSMLVGCLEFGEKGKNGSDSIDGGEGLKKEQVFCQEKRQFAGHEFDEDVQLYYARARFMDPTLGAFISEDPARDGGNWFVYCLNNPLLFIDPMGLEVKNEPDVNNEEYGKYQDKMYVTHIMPDSEKVYYKFANIMKNGEYEDKKLSTYYENIYLYTLITEGKIKAEDSLFNARDRESIAEIRWQVESSLIKLRMSRDTGKFSYLTANKERNGKNPQIADLNDKELILLADTMRKEVKTTIATYAIVSIAAHWALRSSILSYNIKTYSRTDTGDAGNSNLHRPYIRNSTRTAVENTTRTTADGRFIDPNTRLPIEGKYNLGHKYGHEFYKYKTWAGSQDLTQQQFNDLMNNANLYQIEDPLSNMSHIFEAPPAVFYGGD